MTDWYKLRKQIVLWEDDFALVVNKPPGLSVMGDSYEIDLVTMAASAGETLLWVNRIDKVTSGAIVLAKSLKSHGVLTRQFSKRTVDKAYLAICEPGHLPSRGTIDLPLLTASSGRIRVATERQHIKHNTNTGSWYVEMANVLLRKSYPSRTDYVNLWDDGKRVVVLAMPVTGRRHQIRVHLAWVDHAILGDPLFSKKSDKPVPRTYLHSLRITFKTAGLHPKRVEVEAKPDSDFWEPVVQHMTQTSPEQLLTKADAIINNKNQETAKVN